MAAPAAPISKNQLDQILAALDLVANSAERMLAAAHSLRSALVEQAGTEELGFDPAAPANKDEGGKLSERGVEVCYRLFDMGKSRYAVAAALSISFSAASHRFNAWQKAGGANRVKKPLK